MTPTGFAPVTGTRFTYLTTPAGAWDDSRGTLVGLLGSFAPA